MLASMKQKLNLAILVVENAIFYTLATKMTPPGGEI